MAQYHYKPTARLQGLRAQVRDYFALQGQRRKLFPRAVLVGLLAGAPPWLFAGLWRGATSSAPGLFSGHIRRRVGAGSYPCRPIYEALLERGLTHEADLPNLEAPITPEFAVHRGLAL